MSIVPKIKVLSNATKENFYCKICNYPLLTFEDFDKDTEYECCEDCYLQFIECRKKEWEKGWRPEKTVVRDYILLKKKNNTRSNK